MLYSIFLDLIFSFNITSVNSVCLHQLPLFKTRTGKQGAGMCRHRFPDKTQKDISPFRHGGVFDFCSPSTSETTFLEIFNA